jgi:cell pole-organizing protein PopZ
MSAANPIPRDNRAADSRPNDPSMEEILASIRRIIADDQDAPGAQPGNVGENDGLGLHQPTALGQEEALVSPQTNSSINFAFNALVASRFVQHSDAIMALTNEMLRPMLKAWLDENLAGMVERLVKAEIERLSQS